jgi:hypothetical protein
MGTDTERRLEGRSSGCGMELADRLGRPYLRDECRQHRGRRSACGACVHGGRSRVHEGVTQMGPLRRRLQDRPPPVGTGSRDASAEGKAPEEQLRLGNAHDRRRARVCVLRQRRTVRFRYERQAGLVASDGAIDDALGLGPGGVADRVQGSGVRRQRQREPVVHRLLRRKDREGGLACDSR